MSPVSMLGSVKECLAKRMSFALAEALYSPTIDVQFTSKCDLWSVRADDILSIPGTLWWNNSIGSVTRGPTWLTVRCPF